MNPLAHLDDRTLLDAVRRLVAQDRATTAELLAHLGEVDARRLYVPLGHPSMFDYCVAALHLSESAAYRRIHAARAARRFPVILAAVAEGRLHLAAVCLISPHLTADNVDELVASVTHRRKSAVERLLAERFAPPLLRAAAGAAPGPVPTGSPGEPPAVDAREQLVPGRVDVRVSTAAPGGDSPAIASTPLAPGRVDPGLVPHTVLRVVMSASTQAKLRRAQDLLAHALPSGDVASVLDRALDALLVQLERRKYASTPRSPRPHGRSRPVRPGQRTVPAHVRRAVWERDQGRCAFVSRDGRRCSARRGLEFDHVDPVASGGRPLINRMRLLCRAHNQFEAEQAFGREFMRRKREMARAARNG